MTTSFAAAQARLNQAVIAHLSDVEIVLDGTPMQGLLSPGYDDAPAAGFGPAGSSPSVMVSSALVPARPEGKTLVITSGPSAGNYKVGNVHPDATGMATLYLIPI